MLALRRVREATFLRDSNKVAELMDLHRKTLLSGRRFVEALTHSRIPIARRGHLAFPVTFRATTALASVSGERSPRRPLPSRYSAPCAVLISREIRRPLCSRFHRSRKPSLVGRFLRTLRSR